MHKNLPHIDILEHYQFVTFRTQDSIDTYLKKIYAQETVNKIKQYKIDQYLDNSDEGAYLYGEVINEIKDYFLSYDKKLFELIALAIMPNHIHVLFKQEEKLGEIMRVLKGGSAHIANTTLKRKGKFWSDKYYDTVVRDEKHFGVIYDYIKNNPIKAGLRDSDRRFYGVYE